MPEKPLKFKKNPAKKSLAVDEAFIRSTLLKLLSIPSPSGYTDQIVHYVGGLLDELGVPFELTRRGAIRANLEGKVRTPDRAIVSHLDTLGAMVSGLKSNGRLRVKMIGHWSARFAEGARVNIFTDQQSYRGTILPLKASGHRYNKEIDTQPVSWDNLEVRVDEKVENKADLEALGFNIGDFVTIDTQAEITDKGFVNARHLDNKAGVAAQLAAIKLIMDEKIELPVDCHPLFTISEEVGTGASSILHGDVASMVSIDNSTVAPGQNSSEYGITIAMADQTGPFDYHLTHKLIDLCKENNLLHQRDVFRYYRSDSTAAIEAGSDIRAALVCFGLDASHGYERTHMDSIVELSKLLVFYMMSETSILRDKHELGPMEGFTTQAI